MGDIKKGNHTVIIITEADKIVATGHLKESMDLAEALKKRGIRVKLFVNEDIDFNMRKHISLAYNTYRREDDTSLTKQLSDCAVIITNLRMISDNMIRKIKRDVSAPIICVDELGGRFLGADIIINPMINTENVDYPGRESPVYAGGKFLILSNKIQAYRRRYIVRDEMKHICISMGGVDRCDSTNKILDTLLRTDADWNIDVVLGGGYPNFNSIFDLTKNHPQVQIYQNINYIYDLFVKSDVAFSAGGNTLHELACIGVPTIVIPTMEHEVENGKTFERFGFGRCLNKSEKISGTEIKAALDIMDSLTVRKKMSDCGRNICDGKGLERTLQIIQETIKR